MIVPNAVVNASNHSNLYETFVKSYTIYKTNEVFRDNLASNLQRQGERTPGFNGQAVTFTLQLMNSPHFTNEEI